MMLEETCSPSTAFNYVVTMSTMFLLDVALMQGMEILHATTVCCVYGGRKFAGVDPLAVLLGYEEWQHPPACVQVYIEIGGKGGLLRVGSLRLHHV